MKIIKKVEQRKQSEWREFLEELAVFVKGYQEKLKRYNLEVVMVHLEKGRYSEQGEGVELHVSSTEEEIYHVVVPFSIVRMDDDYALFKGVGTCLLEKNSLIKKVEEI